MNNSGKTVVVLSRNLTTGLGVVRSLGVAGYTVDLFANVRKKGRGSVAASSKYVNDTFEVVSTRVKNGDDTAILESLINYGNENDEKRVLIPTDDYTTLVIDSNRNELEKYFIMPSIVNGGQGALVKAMNKRFQSDLAKKVGLLTPQEWIISLDKEVMIPEDMVYPCFCKPMDISSGTKKEMEMCNDEEELINHLLRMQKKDENREIIVQEFLDIDSELAICGVCADQNIIAPAVLERTDSAQYRDGITLAGKVLDLGRIGEMQENVINFLKELHYVGMFNMELIVSNGKLYFNEVNLRSGLLNYAYFKSGVNLPNLFVKTALNETIEENETEVESYNKKFLYETAAWKDCVNGFITKEMFDKSVSDADITFLHDQDDMDPVNVFFDKRNRPKRKKKDSKALRRIKRRLRPIKHQLLGYPQTKPENQRDPEAERPRVVVCGRNYCSNLCMARALGKAGYEVEILRIFQRKPRKKNLMKILKPDAYSKYVKAYRVCISRRSVTIVNRLNKMADPNRKMLLIPTDDLVAHIADEYMEELSENYLMPNVDNKPGEINRMMSKDVQKELALNAGLPVLNSCVIKTEEGQFEIPETVGYPCFIKPNISKNGSKTKMRRCDSEEELREALTEISEKKDVEMLVEDFVDIKKEYSILGVSTKEGAIGPGFFGAEEGGQNEHRGVALIGKVLPTEMMQDLIDDLVKFVGSLNYTGLYDIDLIETVDGKVYFVELNMRYGGSGYSIVASGLNLPGMFADYMLLNKPLDMNAKLENTGKKFVSEKIMIEEYIKGRIPMSKVKESMNKVDIHFIMDKDDPKPYSHFKKFYSIASVKRTMDSFKNK